MSSVDIRPSGQGEINYGNPLLTPLVFRALNPLGVGLDFTREEVRNRAQHVSKDYVLTMEASGVTPNAALAMFGVNGSDPITSWNEAQYFVFQQVMRQMESYDRFMSGGLNYE